MKKFGILISIVVLSLIVLMGCGISINPGITIKTDEDSGNKSSGTEDIEITDTKVEKNTIKLENGVNTLKSNISFGVGKLNIIGGSSEACDATFTYNVLKWKPEISSILNGTTQEVSINQPHSSSNGVNSSKVKYIWDLNLNKNLPLDLNLSMGVGDGNIDLKDTILQHASVKCGVGNITLDLAKNYRDEVNVNISGGVGNITLYVPKTMGVNAVIEKGLGSVKCSGLTKNNDGYSNENYGKSSKTMNIQIKTGVGSINIIEK